MTIEKQLFSKIKIMVFIIILVSIYLYNISNMAIISSEVEIIKLGFQDVILILFINVFIVHILILYSFIGLSLPMTIIFMHRMITSGINSSIPLTHYYLSSYSNGTLELIVYMIIFSFTIDLFCSYARSFKRNNIDIVKKRVLKFIKYEYPFIIIIIFIASILEVYVSNYMIVILN